MFVCVDAYIYVNNFSGMSGVPGFKTTQCIRINDPSYDAKCLFHNMRGEMVILNNFSGLK